MVCTPASDAEVLHLALFDQIFDCARHILDRNDLVDAMLVEQVDDVRLKTLE